MYKVIINLGNRNEYRKFCSLWAAMYMAKKYGDCYDVKNVAVCNDETGELGLMIEKGEITFMSSDEI